MKIRSKTPITAAILAVSLSLTSAPASAEGWGFKSGAKSFESSAREHGSKVRQGARSYRSKAREGARSSYNRYKKQARNMAAKQVVKKGAKMVSRKAGGIVTELAWPKCAGEKC
jgi:hypothetical protein